MPTDDERRAYPHMTDDGWKSLERLREKKERGEYPYNMPEGPPTFEEQVLELLREQVGLLREIRDRLRGGVDR